MRNNREKAGRTLTFEQVKELIPQRFPFIMLDRIEELLPGKRAVGIKNLSGNEWFYQGHFPDHAITPGAMLLEAMAQVGIVFCQASMPRVRGKTFLLGSARVRFLKPVLPGAQISIEIAPVRLTSKSGILTASVRVEGEVIATAELGLSAKELRDA